MPWSVLYLIAPSYLVILLNSLNIFPASAKTSVIQANQFLLAISLAAMGLETNLAKMKQAGLKPLCLGAVSWVFKLLRI
jgi:uncharacterized membrane protein YadS